MHYYRSATSPEKCSVKQKNSENFPMKNLNEIRIPDADGHDQPLADHSSTSEDGNTEIYFRNLENILIRKINEADIIVGCIAWLTSEPIINALSEKDAVSIIVQKEDFLRPDMGKTQNWKGHIGKIYKRLKKGLSRYDEGLKETELYLLSSSGDPSIEPIRCVGNHNRDKAPAFPRMHNKFLIFCKNTKKLTDEDWTHDFIPYAVWSGSFNLTKNALNSFENAIFVRDQTLVRAYFKEYGQIAALSEKLNWESDWVAPEWRIGT